MDVTTIGSDELRLDTRVHPWALVLSQDCDTAYDFDVRQSASDAEGHHKELPNVLLVEALTEDELRARPQVMSDIMRRIRSNQDERFHTLDEVPPHLDSASVGVPPLFLDFKRLFSLRTDELYIRMSAPEGDRNVRRCHLLSPFREQVVSRAFAFQARTAVPD